MIVRCKAFVANMSSNEYGHTIVNLNLAYSQTPGTENFQFHAASPSGNLKLTYYPPQGATDNPGDVFVPGTWWYIDTERVEEMTEVEPTSFCWLSGIEKTSMYYYNSVAQEMVKQESGQIRSKCRGRFNGMDFESDIYIANEAVFSEFAEIGMLYKLSFTQTTKV